MDEQAEDRNQETPNLRTGRRLILMRHAKSDWGDASLSDHDRPLNARGQRDAPRMADWLADLGWIPDLVLSSSSQRTRETIARMNECWDVEPTTSFTQALYLASPESILDCIRSDGGDASQLMVLAHNPGISYLASVIADQSLEMPTAAIAIFDVDVEQWFDFRQSTSTQLIEFMRPKALP